MIQRILSLLGAVCFSALACAQNAPVTTAATVTNAVPGSVQVPLTVVNFTNIGAISLTIDYKYSVMHYVSCTPNPLLMPFMASDADLGNGNHRITMGWFGSGKTLADGSTILTLNFTFIGGSTALTWYDDGASCEYADGNYNVLNDIPTSSYYINGYVCGILSPPGAISGDNSICTGQSGVYYSVDPVPGAGGYAWTVPPGAVISGGGSSTWIYADYPAGSSSGYVTVAATNDCGTGPSSQLYVTVNPTPDANAGNDTTILYLTSATLHAASGGAGTYGYHWSPEYLLVDPDAQTTLTVPLVSTTIFTVLVTNLSTYCQNTDQVTVSVSGGPLTVNPVAVPDSVCKGSSSQLSANAGGGSGSYTYAWTCVPPGSPPWSSGLPDPLVTPDTNTIYYLSVSDGFNTADGSVAVHVTPVPGTPVIVFENDQLASDTCCGNQWYLNGLPVPGAVGQTFTPEEEGLYFDIVRIGECSSDTSNTIYLFAAGEGDPGRETGLILFPNPADNILWLSWPGIPDESLIIRVFSMDGREMIHVPTDAIRPDEPFRLDVSTWSPGLYAATLLGNKGTRAKKVFLVR